MNCLKYFLFFPLLLSFTEITYSQPKQKDTASYNAAIDSIKALYTKVTASQLLLYNGSEYLRSPTSTKGHPFFEWENAVEGSLFYDGNLYQEVNMQYDIAKDELVIENYSHNNVMRLVPGKISFFTLQQHAFIYFMPGKNSNMTPGFYEELTAGEMSIFVKREKRFTRSSNAEDNSTGYNQLNYYFIKKGTGYYAVADKQDLLSILKDKKDVLKKYIRQNQVNFKKDFEGSMVAVITYYSGLNK
jgi:hypothetical protein